ncbi:MAG: peptide chain release factor N(5)-glutamine methyltransferase [Vibrionaceae bacterium]
MTTVETALHQAVQRLACCSQTAHLDARLLLSHLLKKPDSFLYTWPETLLDDAQVAQFEALLARREQGEPVAYLLGYRDFWTLQLHVAPCTLIPRPETELLVELALELLPHTACRALDLGTGTGAIALALASERADVDVLGVDFAPDAVALAKKNQEKHAITNARFLQSDWFSNIGDARFALIVSNPPYIDGHDPHLGQGDVRFEPRSALVADDHGLADLRKIAQESVKYLEILGWLLVEHGCSQGAAVRDIFAAAGFEKIATKLDLSGLERVTLGCFCPKVR